MASKPAAVWFLALNSSGTQWGLRSHQQSTIKCYCCIPSAFPIKHTLSSLSPTWWSVDSNLIFHVLILFLFFYFNIAELQVSSDFSLWLNLKTAELILTISPIWFCTWSCGPSIPTVCLPSHSLPHSLSLSSLSCLGFDLHFPTQCPGLLLESGIQSSLSFFLACFLSVTQVCYRFFSDISSFCDCFKKINT